MDAHEHAALIRAGRPPKLDPSEPYGAALYKNTQSWPEWWRRQTFGDDLIDAEADAQQAVADKQRADELQEYSGRLEDENRRLRRALAHRRRDGRRRHDKGESRRGKTAL